MLDIQGKVTAAIATGSLLLTTFAGPALGATQIDIGGNGSDSDNRVRVETNSRINVDQRNNGDFTNSISVSSNTGGNTASRNTDGDNDITTGDAAVSISVTNRGNVNRVMLNQGSDDNGTGGSDGNGDNTTTQTLRTSLTGEEEVPGPGDPDGTGRARIRINAEDGELCARLQVSNIETATAAHIHEGEEGVAGPVVVTLPTPDEDGEVTGCVDVDEALAMEILDNPEEYYVNVHNEDYPDGAVRGQL